MPDGSRCLKCASYRVTVQNVWRLLFYTEDGSISVSAFSGITSLPMTLAGAFQHTIRSLAQTRVNISPKRKQHVDWSWASHPSLRTGIKRHSLHLLGTVGCGRKGTSSGSYWPRWVNGKWISKSGGSEVSMRGTIQSPRNGEKWNRELSGPDLTEPLVPG